MMRRAERVAAVLAVGMGLSAAHAQSKPSPPGLTGLWETELSVAVSNGDLDKAAASAPAPPAGAPAVSSAPSDAHESGQGGPTPLELALFKRVQLWQKPPYNPEWEQKVQDAQKRAPPPRPAEVVKHCASDGFPSLMESFAPDGMLQVVVTQAETLFLFPGGEVRQVYTDGRKHPEPDDLWPTLIGDSIGHWAGAALMIDTIARKSGPDHRNPASGHGRSERPGSLHGALAIARCQHAAERAHDLRPTALLTPLADHDPLQACHGREPDDHHELHRERSGHDRQREADDRAAQGRDRGLMVSEAAFNA